MQRDLKGLSVGSFWRQQNSQLGLGLHKRAEMQMESREGRAKKKVQTGKIQKEEEEELVVF